MYMCVEQMVKNPMSTQNFACVLDRWLLMENNSLVSPLWELWLNMINTLISVAGTNQTSNIRWSLLRKHLMRALSHSPFSQNTPLLAI